MTQAVSTRIDGTVLVVDDDLLLLRSIERVLRQRGLDVVVQHRSFGVLNRLAEVRPDLMLLDVRMPGLDGTTLTSLVRNDPTLSSTRIVLHSAMPERELSDMALLCGADGYFAKSATMDGVAAAVIDWLARWRRPKR